MALSLTNFISWRGCLFVFVWFCLVCFSSFRCWLFVLFFCLVSIVVVVVLYCFFLFIFYQVLSPVVTSDRISVKLFQADILFFAQISAMFTRTFCSLKMFGVVHIIQIIIWQRCKLLFLLYVAFFYLQSRLSFGACTSSPSQALTKVNIYCI